MSAPSSSSGRQRLLLAALAGLLVVGLLLSPTLYGMLRSAARIDREVDARERAAKEALQRDQELAAALKAVEEGPGSVEARLKLASLLGADRRYEEAIPHLLAAVRLAPARTEPRLALAEVMQANQFYDRAVSELRRATELEPGNSSIWLRLGQTYIALDWNRAALEAATKARGLSPADPAPRVLLSLAHYQMRDYGAALRELESVRSENSKAPVDGPLADVYFQLGRYRQSLEAADAAIRAQTGNLAARVARARALRALRELPASVAAAREAVEINPDDLAAKYELALSLREAGEHGEALRALEEIVGKSFGYGSAALLLAGELERQGRRVEGKHLRGEVAKRRMLAEESTRWSLRVGERPGDAEAHFRLGRSYLERGHYPRAIAEFREAERLSPGDRRIKPLLVRSLRAGQRPAEAAAIEEGRSLPGASPSESARTSEKSRILP